MSICQCVAHAAAAISVTSTAATSSIVLPQLLATSMPLLLSHELLAPLQAYVKITSIRAKRTLQNAALTSHVLLCTLRADKHTCTSTIKLELELN
jgi:ABC-type amino acid transport system permease subunit